MATASLRTFLKQLTQGMAAETLNEQTDRQLVERFLARREEAAFEAIVRRHGAMVYRVCWRVLGQHQETEDAFQATFLLLAQKLRTVRNHDSLASWLHGVAHRVALQAKGRTARRRRHEQRATMAPVERSADLSAEELLAVLDAELGKLPDKWRLPLILCYLEGRTQEESASQLGWSKSTLRRRLEEARDALGCRLKERGLVWSAVLSAGLLSDCVASAALPAGLVGSAARAATLVTAGRAAASVVSPKVALLTEGMVKAMFFRKLKMAAILFLAIAGSGMGLVFVLRGLPRADAGGPVEQAAPQEQPKLGADAGARPGADMSMPIRSLSGHTDRLTSVAFSPDGRWIATAAWDGTARLWDAQTGKEMRCLIVPPTKNSKPGHLTQVLFSPDNEFVVIAQRSMPDEPGVIVWNRRTGERVRDFPGPCAALSPDGKHIACGGWNLSTAPIRLYEFPTGKLVREMRGEQERIESLTFSPDGTTLSGTGPLPRPAREGGPERLGFMPDVTRVWDVATGKERRSALHEVELGGLTGQRLAQSPDGRSLAVGSSLLEMATGRPRAILTGHTNDVCTVAFSPDGRTLASGSMDGTVRLWDLPSGKEIGRFGEEVPRFAGRGWVLAVAFSPDGQTLVSGGLDKKAHIWEVSKITGRKRESAERSPADLETDWKDLAGDAAAGYAALSRLVLAHGSAVAFLGKQLQSIKPVDTKRIERLLADLDSDQFAVREQATKALEALAEHAAPALRTALTGKPSLESRRRLEALLHRLESASLSSETVRQIRAVEALESIGNPEARRLLDKLAAGPAETRLTQEARASAERLAKRASVAP